MAIDRSARGIHWSALDEDISVYNLLAGMPRIYEQHQAQCYRDCRYRVLFLALRGSRRVSQFLDLAAQQQSDPNRTIFDGAYLNDYQQSSDR